MENGAPIIRSKKVRKQITGNRTSLVSVVRGTLSISQQSIIRDVKAVACGKVDVCGAGNLERRIAYVRTVATSAQRSGGGIWRTGMMLQEKTMKTTSWGPHLEVLMSGTGSVITWPW